MNKNATLRFGLAALLTSSSVFAQSNGAPPGSDGAGSPPGSDGSLAPPPPLNPVNNPQDPNGQTGAEGQLKESEKEDSGRNFELFWTRAEAGLSYMNLASFSADKLAIEKNSSFGGMFGLGLGVRLVLLTVGARLRYHALSAFNMWQVNAVVGLNIPIKSWDLGFALHGGYSFVGSLSDSSVNSVTAAAPNPASGVSITGFNAGLGASLDYYLTPLFSIGGGATFEGLFLKRPAAQVPAGVPADVKAQLEASDLYKNSGTGAGIGIAGGLRAGFHLGI